jgi:hypothetical protein
MQSGLCSAYNTSNNHKEGGGGGATILGQKLQGDYNRSELDNLGSQYCGNEAHALSDSDYSASMKKVVSEAVVHEWGECMKLKAANQGGLVSYITGGDSAGSDITFGVRWVARYGVNDAPVADLSFNGAKCMSEVVYKGSRIGTEWETVHCTRDGTADVRISVQAAEGKGYTEQRLPALAGGDVGTPGQIMKVQWQTSHGPIPGPLADQRACTCVSVTSNAADKTVSVRNECYGILPMMGIKDTRFIPPSPEDNLYRSQDGRTFGYVEIPQHATAIFDGRDAVGNFNYEIYDCPGVRIPRLPLRCQVGQLLPPNQSPGCAYKSDGTYAVGEPCTCAVGDGRGVLTQ